MKKKKKWFFSSMAQPMFEIKNEDLVSNSKFCYVCGNYIPPLSNKNLCPSCYSSKKRETTG